MKEQTKQEIVEVLEDHFSRNWEFSYLKTRPEIKYKFKDNKRNIKGRLYLEQRRFEYEVDSKECGYEYTEYGYIEEEFLTSFIVFYPYHRGYGEDFDEWIEQWMHDKKRRNVKYRKLIGEYEG